MAKSARICSRWFWMTSRMMPYWSKYPPRPSVPKFSLKMTCVAPQNAWPQCQREMSSLKRTMNRELKHVVQVEFWSRVT